MARPYAAPAIGALALLLLVGLGIPPANGAVAVDWPPSTELLISELQTGGASASDEFVELYNAAPDPVDLSGLEVVYVTATGATVTRKASWTDPLLLEAGGHLLLANGAGAYAGIADVVYTNGLAAAGGAVVLRVTGGATIDALAWGDATNGFVEGNAAAAPAAGQSLERLPGGSLGSGLDTNDGAVDFAVRATPDPQDLLSPPIPWSGLESSPTPSPASSTTNSPAPSASPVPTSSLTVSPSPTASATPTSTPTPSSSATPAPTTVPSPSPTASPSPTSTPSPTASSAPSPSASPSESPIPEPITIAEARALPDGSAALIGGTLTTALGLIESGHAAFVQDDSAGIGLYLATADWPSLAAGTSVRVSGTITSRYGQLTLRLASPLDVVALGQGGLPAPLALDTGAVDEAVEGSLAEVQGTVTAGPDTLSDGFAVTVDDGTGALRVVAGAATGIAPGDLERGRTYRLVGVAGQRDSSGTGAEGYRLYLRSLADVGWLPDPSPDPSPGVTPSPGPSSTAGPSPTGSAGPATLTIAQARRLPLDSQVTLRGVVTAEIGRVSDDRSFAIQDSGAGIVVRLDGQGRTLPLRRGTWVEVSGILGQRHDNLELRVPDGGKPSVLGTAAVPAPLVIGATGLDEAREGRLVRLSGVVSERTRSATGTLTVIVEDATGQARVIFLPAVGAGLGDVARGQQVVVTGVCGQYSSAHGRPDGYRLWARDLADLTVVATAAPGADSGTLTVRRPGALAGPATGNDPSASGLVDRPAVVALADLESQIGRLVRVSGRIDALAASALTIEDDSGQAQVLLDHELGDVVATLRIGDVLNVVGLVRRGPDDDPVVEPRGPGDLVVASSLGGAAGAGRADPGGAADQGALDTRSDLAPTEPQDRPVAVVSLGLSLALAVGAAGTLVMRRRKIEHLFFARLAGRLPVRLLAGRRRPAGAGQDVSPGGPR
jgi:uncharacterized protein YdeI (BOF family)